MSSEDDRRAVIAAVRAFGDALNRGDYAAVVEMISPEGSFWPRPT